MKLLTTSKIEQALNHFFKSEEQLFIPFKDKSGKSPIRCFTGIQLSRFHNSIRIIIDRILHYQKFKRRGLVNIHPNLFVNISVAQFDSLIPQRHRIVSLDILENLGVVIINHNHAYKSPKLLGKPFSKSYRIHPDYYDQIISIEGVSLKDDTKPFIHTNRGVSLKDNNLMNKQDVGVLQCRYKTPLRNDDKRIIDYLTINHHKLGVESSNITKSSITGWIYSPISGMERSLRKQLIEDHNLVDIDITRCHLQFILALIRKSLSTYEYVPNDIDAFEHELSLFESDVIDTDFYLELKNRFDQLKLWTKRDHNKAIVYRELKKDNGYYKKKVKEVVMTWIASSRGNWKSIAHLNARYPYISHFCRCYNQGTTKRLLNKLMSDVGQLINSVTEYMAINYPSSISCSIYDGYIVDQSHAYIMYDLLQERGTEFLGFPILLKTNKPITNMNTLNDLTQNEATMNEARKDKDWLEIALTIQENKQLLEYKHDPYLFPSNPTDNASLNVDKEILPNIYDSAFNQLRSEIGQSNFNLMISNAVDTEVRKKYFQFEHLVS